MVVYKSNIWAIHKYFSVNNILVALRFNVYRPFIPSIYIYIYIYICTQHCHLYRQSGFNEIVKSLHAPLRVCSTPPPQKKKKKNNALSCLLYCKPTRLSRQLFNNHSLFMNDILLFPLLLVTFYHRLSIIYAYILAVLGSGLPCMLTHDSIIDGWICSHSQPVCGGVGS